MLTVPEIKTLLTGFGFSDLDLISTEELKKTFTFKFGLFNHALMPVKPTMAADGQVAEFTVPEVGKFGVSKANRIVRFIDAGLRAGQPQSSDAHITKIDLPTALQNDFNRATIGLSHRVTFMTKLWHYLNQHKFQSQMQIPKLECGPKPRLGGVNTKNTRGCYFGGPHFGPGDLWMNPSLFNGRLSFFLEIFLHEMCHEAKWTVTKSTDTSEQGHGPEWKKWMVHVGLDPRRGSSPTDDYEYQDAASKAKIDEKLSDHYGSRAPASKIKALKKLTQYVQGPATYVYRGRILHGTLDRNGDGEFIFKYLGPTDGRIHRMYWYTVPQFVSLGLPNLYEEST